MAESVVYCKVLMNLDEFNISQKTLFTSTFLLILCDLKYDRYYLFEPRVSVINDWSK